MAKKKQPDGNIVARNRKARHNYFIEDNIEAGLVLVGTEVKSLRSGRASIEESYAAEQDGELFLVNAYIPKYQWFAALLFTIAPVIWVIKWRKRRKLGPNACNSCGYDLTGNETGICPECGVATKLKSAQT